MKKIAGTEQKKMQRLASYLADDADILPFRQRCDVDGVARVVENLAAKKTVDSDVRAQVLLWVRWYRFVRRDDPDFLAVIAPKLDRIERTVITARPPRW